MAMADVYCLFNRARGTELVSPDDLLQACCCFPQAGVPLRIKEFSTGALAVQSQSHSTEQVRERTMQCTVRQQPVFTAAAGCAYVYLVTSVVTDACGKGWTPLAQPMMLHALHVGFHHACRHSQS